MAKIEKNFTWTMVVELKDGTVKKCNEANEMRGYKKSWYATETAARKALRNQIAMTTKFGNIVASWAVSNRAGIIERG